MVATAQKRYPHEPDYAVSPGEVLQETIDALGMTQVDLAKRTGLSKKTINQIIRGHEPISCDTALRLERVTSVPARLWNNLEATFRERLARLEEKSQLAQDLEWLQTIPTKELICRGAIQEQEDRFDLLQAVLAFFGVNSPREWWAVWESPQVAFRRSQVFRSNPGALAAWIRLGELEGQRLACRAYDKGRFRKALEQVRRLTVEGPEVFVQKMRELCAEAGVAVVFTPEIKGAPVSGATQWLTPDKALLQLSLRFKTNDHFWFSFFHEAGHILKHGKKEQFVEDGEGHDAKEAEANRFAEDFLIPPDRAGELRKVRTREQIVAFAKSVGLAPGIVLGRLQKMDVIGHRCADNNLKERLRWSEGEGGGEINSTSA
jgi:HTH-type transcriptional regulator / antitoxin HigA